MSTTSTSATGPNRFVLMRKALKKRLGFYPFRSCATREQAEREARSWWYQLAGSKYETEFRVIDAAARNGPN